MKINKIQKTYTLNEEQHFANEEQHFAIAKAREQIKNGDFLTNEQANQEIDEWLNK